MLLRIDPDDPSTVAAVEACGRAVSELAGHRLMAMVEPFIAHRVDGRVRIDLGVEATIRAMTVAAGIDGNTLRHTWLESRWWTRWSGSWPPPPCRPCCWAARSPAPRTPPSRSWRKALKLPTVQGLVIGRLLLYPPDDDVATAVDTAVGLLQEGQ